MRTSYDVAIRMESKKLANGVTLFKPTNAISGEYNFSSLTFTSIDEENYYTQDAFIDDFDNGEDYICSNIMTSDEFNEKYGHFKTFKDALKQYKEDSFKYKLVYFDERDVSFKSFEFDLFDLLQSLSTGKFNGEFSAVTKQEEISNSGDDSDYSVDLSSGTAKVLGLYYENKRNKKACIDIYNVLDGVTEDLVRLMYDITVDYPEEFEKKTNLSVSTSKKSGLSDSLKYTPKSLSLEEKKKFYEERKRVIENIKKVIIAQDEEVEKIVVEIFKLIRQYGTRNKGILLTGSTGCGKSKICELIAENLGRHCKIVDTTQISAPGYKGRDIESYLEELYDEVGGNKDKAQNSVIVFDEVDKLGISKRDDDVSGIQVLNRLLMFLNGTNYEIRARENGRESISTKNMIVIFCGSFSSVYKNPKFFKNELGFSSTHKSKTGKVIPTTDDFISLGGMPDEMMGRLPAVVHLNDLTKEDLKNILLKSSESPIQFAKAEFLGEAGVELDFTDDAIDAIVEEAYKLKTNARALSRVITDSLSDAFVVVTDNIGVYSKVVITGETISDKTKYKLYLVEEKGNEKTKVKN